MLWKCAGRRPVFLFPAQVAEPSPVLRVHRLAAEVRSCDLRVGDLERGVERLVAQKVRRVRLSRNDARDRGILFEVLPAARNRQAESEEIEFGSEAVFVEIAAGVPVQWNQAARRLKLDCLLYESKLRKRTEITVD
jgi:hypothetical protein